MQVSPVHNTTQRVDAADARIEPKPIPTFMGAFYPSHSMHCIIILNRLVLFSFGMHNYMLDLHYVLVQQLLVVVHYMFYMAMC